MSHPSGPPRAVGCPPPCLIFPVVTGRSSGSRTRTRGGQWTGVRRRTNVHRRKSCKAHRRTVAWLQALTCTSRIDHVYSRVHSICTVRCYSNTYAIVPQSSVIDRLGRGCSFFFNGLTHMIAYGVCMMAIGGQSEKKHNGCKNINLFFAMTLCYAVWTHSGTLNSLMARV